MKKTYKTIERRLVAEEITFNILKERFLEKYPDGKIYRHGEMADTDVAVIFTPNSRVYNYKGTYWNVALKLGLTEEKWEEVEVERIDYFNFHSKIG